MAHVRMRVRVPEEVARRFNEQFGRTERSNAIVEGIELLFEKRKNSTDSQDLISDYKLRAAESTAESEDWDVTLRDGIADED
ncbi:MAG: hypothetical protein J0L82_10090 [Deltaproteobacteria bacterium]|nr:hypothetical protein [Deltaproteobacteria bacterium]